MLVGEGRVSLRGSHAISAAHERLQCHVRSRRSDSIWETHRRVGYMRSRLRIFCHLGLDHPGKHRGDLSRSMHFCFAEQSTLQWPRLKPLPPR